MNLSYQWLKEYLDCDLSAQEVAALLTKHAQEVEAVNALFETSHLAYGKVLEVAPIAASKNKKCTVEVDHQVRTIVCGATNVAPGQTVIVALPGAVLPSGKTIDVATFKDVTSEGMICSLSEIGISPNFVQESGIHVVQGEVTEALLKDTVITLDLTPNRMDLLSVLGCAYEVGALIDKAVKIPPLNLEESATENPYKITIETDQCYRYLGRLIENITVQESPEWLKMRLLAAGIRPINNVVDVTNYVMIDLGQPLHAFDDATLPAKTIKVRQATAQEKFTTLDQHVRTLDPSDIVITDGTSPIALGGVMGGLDSEVTPTTQHVFLESAVFAPKAISKTSRRLDLRSESSMRFERGVAADRTRLALDKAAALIAQLAKGTVAKGVIEATTQEIPQQKIQVSLAKINQTLGLDLTLTTVEDIFKKLALPYQLKGQTFEVNVPPRRLDLEVPADLIEEIGRVYGYDQLPASLPTTVSDGSLSPEQWRRRQIKTHLESLGFNEVITYSLSQEKKDLPFIDVSKPVTILRPIHEDNQTLKQSLIPGLLDVIRYHQARQMDDLKIYEWSKSYTQAGEDIMLGIAWVGRALEPSWEASKGVNFYHLKGIVEHLFRLLNVTVSYQPCDNPGYHPYQSANIMAADTWVGRIGQGHPLVLRDYDLKDVFIAEINISKAFLHKEKKASYQPVSKVPSVIRDVAFIGPETMPAQRLIDAVYAADIDALNAVEVIDVYQGSPLQKDEKSMTIRVQLSADKTFTSEAIDERIKALIKTLEKTLKLRQRV